MGEMQEIYANIEYEIPDDGKPRTIQTSPESSQKTFYGPVAVFLGLLNVLLLAGIVVLGFLYSARLSPAELSIIKANLTERLQSADQQVSSLTEQRDLLNVSLTNMRREMEKLQSLSKQKKTCPAGWKMFQCSCYLFSTERLSWDRSRQDCRNRDADLVVINSFEEQEFLTNNFKDWTWIGLSDKENESTWKWADGTLLTKGYWSSGQPDNGGGHEVFGEEDCAHFINGRAKEGNWNDLLCDTSMLWICEK